MITHASTVSVFVTDQDRALDFYVDKLGFEKRRDQGMGPNAPRWLEVAPPGAQTALLLYKPTETMPGASTYALAQSLIGTFAPFILNVEDMESTCAELSARGVEFGDQPAKQYFGWWATIKDPDGNILGLHAD
jgi:lactoylglutathione lyase